MLQLKTEAMETDSERQPGRDPTLLLVAYAFPPSTAVGALRCWNIAKQLSALGWRITVVTVDPEILGTVRDTAQVARDCASLGIRRVLTGHGLRFLTGGWLVQRWWERLWGVQLLGRAIRRSGALEFERGWWKPLRAACLSLKHGDFDLVLASGPPHESFVHASEVARRVGAKCILDYRDLWMDSPHGSRRRERARLANERTALANADGVIAASPSMLNFLTPWMRPEGVSFVLLNGYEPMDFESVPAAQLPEGAVVYAGMLYPPKNVIDPVLDAILAANRLATSERKWLTLHYYGPNARDVRAAAAARGAEKQVEIHGVVPRREVIGALKGCMCSAVITTIGLRSTSAERTIVTSKIFEAMGAGARILLITPTDSDARSVLDDSGAGKAFSSLEVEAAGRWLREMLEDRREAPPRDTSKYAWPIAARRLDTILRDLVRKR